MMFLNVTHLFLVLLLGIELISAEASFRSDLRITGIQIISQNTQKRNNTVWHPTPSNSSLSTSSSSTTSSALTPSSTNKQDGAVKSEIYKMHNNGLMLLHPQRPRSGSESKKSLLLNFPAISSINYHVRKRIKENETESTVADNEHFLESKLGDLPQIQGAREANSTEQYIAKINSENEHKNKQEQEELQQQTLLERSTENNLSNCLHTIHPCVSDLSTWRSIIQGENTDGGEIKYQDIYPKSKRSQFKNKKIKISEQNLNFHNNVKKKSYVIIKGSEKHNNLLRVFRNMEDDPLFDDDQPEETLRRYNEKRRLLRMREKFGKAYGRANIDIPAIPPIPKIQNRIEKLEPLEHIPRFSDFGQSLDNWPRFGVPELELMHYPRFSAPKLDDFELIPGIPHIRQLDKSGEVTGDKRGFPVKEEEFVDEELESDLKANTAPTPIPELTDIPSLTDIPDIPTIKPAPSREANTSEGVNGKMPVMQTVDTKDGKETRISA